MGKNTGSAVVGWVLTALSALLIIGVLTFAAPCGVHDDGSVSTCFWAGRAVLGVGVVTLLLAVVRALGRDEGQQRGLSLAVANLGVLAAAIPGGLIDLCMMQTMRCHTVMRPFVLCVGSAIALVAAVDVVARLLRQRKTSRA